GGAVRPVVHELEREGGGEEGGELCPLGEVPVPARVEDRVPRREVFSDADLRRSEEHTSELQSRFDLVCRLLLEKKKRTTVRRAHLRVCWATAGRSDTGGFARGRGILGLVPATHKCFYIRARSDRRTPVRPSFG